MRHSSIKSILLNGILFILIPCTVYAQNYLSGRVFNGNKGDESTPIGGVTVKLYGSANPDQLGTQIGSTITDEVTVIGWYQLLAPEGYEYYHIVEINLSGYHSTGVSSVDGDELDYDHIRYSILSKPLADQTLTGNKFWDAPDAPANTKPKADANGPYTGKVGLPITLDGSGSYDPDAGDSIVSYGWDLDGDGQYDDATVVKPSYTWNNPLNMTISLKVRDTHGASDTDDANVTITEADEYEWDFGDAPEDADRGYYYPTTLANNGACHRIVRIGPWLGSAYFNDQQPDAEPDGQPDLDAQGDDKTDRGDESGCIGGYLIVGVPHDIYINVGSGGIIDAWVDADRDGMWQHPAEQIFSGYKPAGSHKINVTLPGSAVPGLTYMRVRISTAGGLTPEGPAGDGEVVDERITMYEADFGDAPNSYGTLIPAHRYQIIDEDLVMLGNSVDGELDGQPGVMADGDDTHGINDEDGVRFLTPLVPGKSALVEITCTTEPKFPCVVDGYMDFHGDGRFDSYDKLFCFGHYTPNAQTVYVRSFMVTDTPADGNDPVEGPTYARFRIMGGAWDWGEIEDYRVIIGDSTLRDYGDAPASYGDASHEPGGPWWGGLNDAPDAESVSRYDPQAQGDDNDGHDDENGIIQIDLIPGHMIQAEFVPGPSGEVTIAYWQDFDGDGTWGVSKSIEWLGPFHYSFGAMPPGGWKCPISIQFGYASLPNLKGKKIFFRFRIYEGIIATVSPTGPAGPGEVEDYVVEIKDDEDPGSPGAVIFGTKWEDRNGDGALDANEPVLPGWQIWLDVNQNGIEDTGDQYDITDASGQFEFNGLSAGQYIVGETIQPGWTQTWPGGTGIHQIPVDPANPSLGIRFGNQKTEPDTGIGAVKWSQPPLFDPMGDDTSCYRGWNESAIYTNSYPVDDWFCHDPRPVTCIRWWGSYAAWDSLFPPPEAPFYFRIGVWTDIPRDSIIGFSHPAKLIQEWFVQRDDIHETIDKIHYYSERMEKPATCFRYTFHIPQNDWFSQEGDSSIYWLSVQAVYNEVPETFLWGWITREHYFNEDALRILQPLRPNSGVFFEAGEAIAEFWDLAFELGTDVYESSYDFGDAPDIGYGTTLKRNGPHHLLDPDIFLGESIDQDNDGQPGVDARGDDEDGMADEDGIQFLNPLIPGEMAAVQVTASTAGLIDAWVDFDGDNSWNQPEEHVLTSIQVLPGTHLMEFPVAEAARTGESFARFRFSTWPRIWHRGFAGNGEVEDYQVTIGTSASVQPLDIFPVSFGFHQNYPNPFNPQTTFRFEIPFNGKQSVNVELCIYNLQGQLIRMLINGERSPGIYQVSWDGSNESGNQVSTGIYLSRFQAGLFTATKKMIMMK